MEQFINPLFGGLLIGLSSILMLALLGKITGISGIFWQFISDKASLGSEHWRGFFLLGLIAGPLIGAKLFNIEIPAPSEAGPALAIIAGFLVGFGTQLGSGCTSGHGVCGIARLSVRSITATLVFMAFGIITVAISRHLI